MEIIGPILISTIAGLSTVLGGLTIFLKIKKENINKFITFCLSFSIAVMIGISITDLIPESSKTILETFGILRGIVICILTFVIGMCLVTFINKKLNKISSKIDTTTDSGLYKVGILSMLALMLHNLPEGIATFMTSYKDISLGISLGIAIMLHNIPEGISIAVPLYYATGSKKEAIKKTFISGLAEPLGAILAFIFLSKFINDVFISIILIAVAGIMITLSINELLPQAQKYKENKYINLGLLCGLIVILIQFFAF